jgi:hypothetical protein
LLSHFLSYLWVYNLTSINKYLDDLIIEEFNIFAN